jgi:hypothetical protein
MLQGEYKTPIVISRSVNWSGPASYLRILDNHLMALIGNLRGGVN